MVCANTDGSGKVPPWVIGESANPRCFNGVNLHRLRMQYRSNGKAWVTMNLFLEWLRWFSKRLHHGRKVVLVLDNFSGHKVPTSDIPANIRIIFLPPNTTSHLQPCDQGNIATLKAYCLKKLPRSTHLR